MRQCVWLSSQALGATGEPRSYSPRDTGLAMGDEKAAVGLERPRKSLWERAQWVREEASQRSLVTPHPLPPRLPSPLAPGCRGRLWVGGARRLAGCRVQGTWERSGPQRNSGRGPAVAGSMRCADVSQPTGYPEAALACVPALAVGIGEEEWVLGSSAWMVGAGGLPVGEGPLPCTTPGGPFT